MPEHTSDAMFDHLRRGALKSLENHIRAATEEPNTARPDVALAAIAESQQKILNEILADVSAATEPKVVFQKGLAALNKVDQQRFVMENMLEAVKRGESLATVGSRYSKLGLSDAPISDAPSVPTPIETNSGKLLRGLIRQLKKVALDLMQLVVNALRAVPQFVAIKPSIGFVAMMPSLSFALEGEAVTIADFCDMLAQNV